MFVTGFPYNREGAGYQQIASTWDKLSSISRATRRTGSAALDIAYVAAGRYDGYVVSGAKVWDVAAGILMVVEAGGCICDLAGGVWGADSTGCIASNGMLHDSLLELVLEG